MDRKTFIKSAALLGMGSLPMLSKAVESGTGKTKCAVVFYSWSGKTEWVAGQISRLCRAPIFELEPLRPYTRNYGAVVNQAKMERDADFKPELKEIPDMQSFDTVFLGTPNWWSTMSSPVRTFVEQGKLKSKTVIPFITHKGSVWGNYLTDLKKRLPDCKFADGLQLYGSNGMENRESQQEIEAWLKKLNLKA